MVLACCGGCSLHRMYCAHHSNLLALFVTAVVSHLCYVCPYWLVACQWPHVCWLVMRCTPFRRGITCCNIYFTLCHCCHGVHPTAVQAAAFILFIACVYMVRIPLY